MCVLSAKENKMLLSENTIATTTERAVGSCQQPGMKIVSTLCVFQEQHQQQHQQLSTGHFGLLVVVVVSRGREGEKDLSVSNLKEEWGSAAGVICI